MKHIFMVTNPVNMSHETDSNQKPNGIEADSFYLQNFILFYFFCATAMQL